MSETIKHHESVLNGLPFMKGVRLGGETPAFEQFVLRDVNPLSGNVKNRELFDPNDAMRAVHKKLIRAVERLKIPMPYATGGLRGGSPANNLRPHADNRYFYLLDLQNAYGQVDMFALAHTLVGYGLDGDVIAVEDFLRQYCSVPDRPGLCTGAPASPLLFNVACASLDERLSTVTDSFGLTYTRYLDDLTFSSKDTGRPDDRIGKIKRRVICDIIKDQQLVINEKKTRVLDLDIAPIVVTGLQLNRSGKWQLPTEYFPVIEREFHGAFDKLAYSPFGLDEREWARVAGRYGLLKSALDTRRGLRTDKERELIETFNRLKRLQRSRIGRRRKV